MSEEPGHHEAERHEDHEQSGDGKQPFALQAARFCFLAPFVAIFIGFISRGFGRSAQNAEAEQAARDAAMLMGMVNLLIVAAGFGLGIAALVRVKRAILGPVLWRSIIGLVLNGLALWKQEARSPNRTKPQPDAPTFRELWNGFYIQKQYVIEF